ncbi:hypothetical protein GCM10027291_29630 [Telluribacter humicola]
MKGRSKGDEVTVIATKIVKNNRTELQNLEAINENKAKGSASFRLTDQVVCLFDFYFCFTIL